MHWLSIILLIITAVTILGILATYRKSSIFFLSRSKTISVGIFALIITGIKWSWGLYNFIMIPPLEGSPNPYAYSMSLSNLLFLNITSLLLLLIGLGLIFDRSKSFAKVIAPIGIFLSLLMILLETVQNIPIYSIIYTNTFEWYKYLFMYSEINGHINEYMPFLSNYILLIISLLTLMVSKQYTKWSVVGTIILFLTIVIYYVSISKAMNIMVGVSGFVAGDWKIPGQEVGTPGWPTTWIAPYQSINSFLTGASNGSYAINILIMISIIIAMTMTTQLFKNTMTLDLGKISRIQDPWYFNSKSLWPMLTPIDAAWCNFLDKYVPSGYFFPTWVLENRIKKLNSYQKESLKYSISSLIEAEKIRMEETLEKRNLNKAKKNKYDYKLETPKIQIIESTINKNEKMMQNVEQENSKKKESLILEDGKIRISDALSQAANVPFKNENDQWMYRDDDNNLYLSLDGESWSLYINPNSQKISTASLKN